ncbi:MAG: hypothetical protein MPN21_21445 [Thermoanaerobaculia bacterium]|nr:hypothetical protein [Thermoanaerobaculia bacterium]
MTPPIGIFGRGRLARAVDDLARHEGTAPMWMVGRGGEPTADVEVAIDASAAGAVEAHLDWALRRGTDLVIAATGWDIPDLAIQVAGRIGVVVAPNGSLTVALLARLTYLLGAFGRCHCGTESGEAGGYLLDHHHAAKADAPSGTAQRLAQAWREGAGSDLGIASLRSGHEVGRHVVGLDAPGEQLEVVHRARSRVPFAHGLLRAAEWVAGRRGLFTLDDVARDIFAGSALGLLFSSIDERTLHHAVPGE